MCHLALCVAQPIATISVDEHQKIVGMMITNKRRVLITGGGTFLGDNIAAALLAEGAEVTLLVRPGREDRLGVLGQYARLQLADVWDSASLRGRARGHNAVIHTVGSMVADTEQGLSYNRANFVSARNVVAMCVSDGVPQMILMSSAGAPWMNRQYIRAKREAEAYLERVGVKGTVIRAPLVYVRGQRRPLFFQLMTLLGGYFPLSWTRLGRIAPMPVDVLARGVARITLDESRNKKVYYARDLWRRNTKEERAGRLMETLLILPDDDDTRPSRPQIHPFKLLNEESPFGWSPPTKR